MAKDKSRARIVGGMKIIVLYALGILFAVVGVVLYPIMDKYIQKKINESLVLKPVSVGYKQWKDPSVPIYLQFFMFDVVNPMEVLNKRAKPFLAQKGPFSYREHRPKRNITWHSNRAAVTYNEKMTFVFDPESSCESCDPFNTEITTVNIPLVTLAEAARNLPDFARVFISAIFDDFKEKLFMKRRVHDLLWGYNDSLFLEYNKIRNHDIPAMFRQFFPEISPLIALQQNNTFEGVTSVHTGKNDINKLVQWLDWKGLTKLKVWNSSYANMINGTDGSQFAPKTSADDTLYVFVTQLCRSLYLTYSGKTTIQGIDAIQFSVPRKAFLNASLNPDNQGFCTSKCFPSGILDVSVCQPPSPINIPLFISAPHFYMGDPSLVQAVEGLSPNKEEHGTFLNIEPHTGISVQSSKRLQINTKVESVKWISEIDGINTMYFPIMFINETATLDSASAKKLKNEVLKKYTIVHGIELGLVILGALLIVIASIMLIFRIVQNRKAKKLKHMLQVNAEPTERSRLLSESE